MRLIDADALIENFGKLTVELWLDSVEEAEIVSLIGNAPTIEAKRGEWIYGEHDVAMCDGYRCDRCGFFVPWDYEHKSIDFINDYNFCPNCGALMTEREGE